MNAHPMNPTMFQVIYLPMNEKPRPSHYAIRSIITQTSVIHDYREEIVIADSFEGALAKCSRDGKIISISLVEATDES